VLRHESRNLGECPGHKPYAHGETVKSMEWSEKGRGCRQRASWLILVLAAEIVCAGVGLLIAGDLSRYSVDGRRSGYTYLSEENQRLQDDDFANPGLLWVERGRELWRQADGAAARSCASCHGNAADSMRGVRTRYPRFDSTRGKLMNLEQQINRCRAEHLQATPYPDESEPLLDLTAFVGFQSRGMPIDVRVDGPSQPFFEAGRDFFYQRRGQLDLACAHCHEQHAEQRLRGEVVSQGQINGFPVYRFTWQTLGSTHRMFEWCNTAVRAEPYPLGSDAYVNLELYLAWRGRGLPVETPAIRR
jgi:L-cysteine S-thiosulfotransferase